MDTPDLADFTSYCQAQGIVAAYTLTTDPTFAAAYDWAIDDALTCPNMPGTLYTFAVYNFGADRFIRIAQDNGLGTFYADQRSTYNVFDFRPGVVMASGQGPTSQTLVVPEWYRELPLSGQELLKTPWGRQYLSYAQMYGPNVVGVS